MGKIDEDVRPNSRCRKLSVFFSGKAYEHAWKLFSNRLFVEETIKCA